MNLKRKYQLVFFEEKKNHAGSKAPQDVFIIAKKHSYEPIFLPYSSTNFSFLKKILNFVKCLIAYKSFNTHIPKGSILLFQYPIYCRNILFKILYHSLKKCTSNDVKIILFIHDIVVLREADKKRIRAENVKFELLKKISSVVIAHNKNMISFLKKNGFEKEKIVNLQIFDYLTDSEAKLPRFEKKVMIAGNLDSKKAGYLGKLNKIRNVAFEFYGPNYDKKNYKGRKFTYKGCFPSEKLPSLLDSGFGLVWDEISIDTCDGVMGNYLRYNNPHKLSLFISVGIPVFVWKQSAEADFVIQNNIGYVISSLYEIAPILEKITEEEYSNLTINVKRISEKLRDGYFTSQSLLQSEQI